MRDGEADRGERQGDEDPRTGDEPWWAGLGWPGGVFFVVVGVALLLWLLLSGQTDDDDWSAYYGAGKVLAIGCVVAGTTLVARGRGRNG
ncbi:hypothetical protein ACFVYR_30675 [Streptomyces sp. NPDC058284]|uniref:hypothetical protein n=1 Tax=unclassified Streptomyces TaxID=2593676 RepID=UPI003665BFFD